MKIVEIEGFQYELTIPNYLEWLCLCQELYQQNEEAAKEIMKNGIIGIGRHGYDYGVLKGDLSYNSQITVTVHDLEDWKDEIYWQPVLYPIKEDGSPDWYFKRIKDGTVVSGGTIYVDEKPILVKDGITDMFTTIRLGDTDEIEALQWYVSDWKLFSKEPLASAVTPELLKECKLI